MKTRLFPSAAALFAVLLCWSEAVATPIIYQSQTGLMSAGADHPVLVGSSEDLPISGLSDVDETLVVSDVVPPNGYEARAELTTSLGATRLVLDGSTTASVEGCDPYEEPHCSAGASIDVTITFDLAEPVFARMQGTWDWSTNNGPESVLTHASLGFALAYNYFGEPYIRDCGSLGFEDCDALVYIFGPGAILPDGGYELVFDLYAFTPMGACSVGCDDARGSFVLEVIPEPTTASLLGLGLVGFTVAARRRRG